MRADVVGSGFPLCAACAAAHIRGRYSFANSLRSGCAMRHFAAQEVPQNLFLSLFFLPVDRNVNSFSHCKQCFVTVLCLRFFRHSREQWICFCPAFPRLLGTNSCLHTGQTFKRVLLRKFSCFNVSFFLRPDLVVGGTLQYPSL